MNRLLILLIFLSSFAYGQTKVPFAMTLPVQSNYYAYTNNGLWFANKLLAPYYAATGDTTLIGIDATGYGYKITKSMIQLWSSGAGGTVTSVSVATNNGFNGVVTNPTTTPSITIRTSVNGMAKGNGVGLSAAVAGTDYVAPATTINTTYPLQGGGNLSANRTIILDTGRAVGQAVTGGRLKQILDSLAAANNTGFIQNQRGATQTGGYKISDTGTAKVFEVFNTGVRYATIFKDADGGSFTAYNPSGSGKTVSYYHNGIDYTVGALTSSLRFTTPTGFRTITVPDATGTVALTTTVWSLSGNAATAGSLAGSFLGTTNNVSFRFRTNNTERMIIDSVGNVGIGTAAPTARLHLPAGTTTAGTAPLKFTAGPVLSVEEDGIMQFDGSHLYFTIGADRFQIDQQGGVNALAAIGASPNANGASISGTTLTLQPASASFGGVVTTAAQAFAGRKEFSGMSIGQAINNYNLDIYGSTFAYFGMYTSASGTSPGDGFQFGFENTGAYAVNRENTPMFFYTNGTERMTIEANGIINIVNTPSYADNAAALAGGLVAGDVYRNGDVLQIVH